MSADLAGETLPTELAPVSIGSSLTLVCAGRLRTLDVSDVKSSEDSFTPLFRFLLFELERLSPLKKPFGLLGGSLPNLYGESGVSREVRFLGLGVVRGDSGRDFLGDFEPLLKDPRPDPPRRRMLPRAANGLDCWTPALARICAVKEEEEGRRKRIGARGREGKKRGKERREG